MSQATIVTTIAGASFTGLAIGNIASGAAQIYAADQNSGNVYVFNSQFDKMGTFTDPNGLPTGLFTAFNVQNLSVNGTRLFVTYANPNNPLGGVVDEYTTDGTFIKRLISDAAGSPSGHALGARHRAHGLGPVWRRSARRQQRRMTAQINAYNLERSMARHSSRSNGGQLFQSGRTLGLDLR